jgi:hypothetical protein
MHGPIVDRDDQFIVVEPGHIRPRAHAIDGDEAFHIRHPLPVLPFS